MTRRSVLALLLVLLAPLVVTAFFMAPSSSRSRRHLVQQQQQQRWGGLTMKADWALLFDCDGVLADTERDGAYPIYN